MAGKSGVIFHITTHKLQILQGYVLERAVDTSKPFWASNKSISRAQTYQFAFEESATVENAANDHESTTHTETPITDIFKRCCYFRDSKPAPAITCNTTSTYANNTSTAMYFYRYDISDIFTYAGHLILQPKITSVNISKCKKQCAKTSETLTY